MRSHYMTPDGIEFVGSSDPLALACQVAGTIVGERHPLTQVYV